MVTEPAKLFLMLSTAATVAGPLTGLLLCPSAPPAFTD